jgi:hypothetical protein
VPEPHTSPFLILKSIPGWRKKPILCALYAFEPMARLRGSRHTRTWSVRRRRFRSGKYRGETAGVVEKNPSQFGETTRPQPAELPQLRWKSKLPAQPRRNSQPRSALQAPARPSRRSTFCPNAKRKLVALPRGPFPCVRIPSLFVELRTRSLANASRHRRKQVETPALPNPKPPIS